MDKAKLLEFIERIEACNGQIADLLEVRKDILEEAKDAGFKTKGINYILKQRSKSHEEREAEKSLFEDYAKAANLED